jgi:hypothetical protein
MAITSSYCSSQYILSESSGETRQMGDGKMSWKTGAIFTIDFTAIMAGVLIAAPFALVLSAPFIAGY